MVSCMARRTLALALAIWATRGLWIPLAYPRVPSWLEDNPPLVSTPFVRLHNHPVPHPRKLGRSRMVGHGLIPWSPSVCFVRTHVLLTTMAPYTIPPGPLISAPSSTMTRPHNPIVVAPRQDGPHPKFFEARSPTG
ncbi:hypothetical protein BO71DRAFT_177424 [Aspergillus ellipticus CBS 707.79]|uniref:Uncharacterized protein n=1 Tax=Aspergillus ellipticus CBS 707.79 TaxID=1448320 RepID=A0A319CQE1_9EURO|nr:hypothetical protein BO71DRAFT_177424 [Aspergillus ellipticus CBS 707.79]